MIKEKIYFKIKKIDNLGKEISALKSKSEKLEKEIHLEDLMDFECASKNRNIFSKFSGKTHRQKQDRFHDMRSKQK